MNKYIIFLCVIFSHKCFSQLNFKKHIRSIKKEKYVSEDHDGKFNANERAVNYAIKYLEEKGIKKKYITNKKLLRKIKKREHLGFKLICFSDTLDNGKVIDLKISFKKFLST